ncbi:MAG: hypothetical protein QNL59_00540 [Actinomycetota bacterium]
MERTAKGVKSSTTSIGSVGSILSIGSSGSVLSVNAVGAWRSLPARSPAITAIALTALVVLGGLRLR